MPGIEVIGRSRASHLRCDPTRLKSVGENGWPAACHRERQKHIVQLGIRVSLLSAPRPLFPREILQARVPALVQAGTQVDEPLRFMNQRSQNVGGKSVDGKHMRQTVFRRDALRLSVSDARIVDDCIEVAEFIYLRRNVAGLSDARKIANDNFLRSRIAARASRPRCSLRACKTKLCPCSMRSCAAIRPSPSEDPVMNTRAIVYLPLATRQS